METALGALKTELGLQHGGHNLDSSPAQGTKEVCTRAPGLGSLLWWPASTSLSPETRGSVKTEGNHLRQQAPK